MVMKNELQRLFEEVVMACSEVVTQHLHGGTEENYNNKFPVRIVCVLFKIQTRHLLNARQKCFSLSQLVWKVHADHAMPCHEDEWGSGYKAPQP
jgi:hypothetical protein